MSSTALQEPLVNGSTAVPISGGDDPANQREIFVLDHAANQPFNYCDNAVATAKYSIIPLSPHFLVWKNLFEQFHKAANLYFLLISCLQQIPNLSPTGKYTTLIPLVFVLLVTMAKDAYEDFKRHTSDRELNTSHGYVWRDTAWVQVPWRDIRVGDLVKVHKGKSFPCDLVLVWSPMENGQCYIETKSLDGETNLKIRKSPEAIYKTFSMDNPSSVQGRIVCELPNNRLYNFDGFYEKTSRGKVTLNADNLLLRGADLRNTHEIVGMCVFTGGDTKLMKNSASKASKMSRVDHVTNRQILLVFLLEIVLCIGCTIGAAVVAATVTGHWYIPNDAVPGMAIIVFGGFGTFLILFNNLIPISLYVTLEMVKVFQARLMEADINMYHHDTDTPAKVNSSSLNEELGQVEYIFSDKTGTLTCNMMDFLKFTCNSFDPSLQKERVFSYGTGTTEIGRAAALREGREIQDDRPPGFVPQNDFYFHDPRINDGAWKAQENTKDIEFLLLFLAVCHDVVPDRESGSLQYQASSPDEACLVKAAKELGVEFSEKTEKSMTIIVNGKAQTWDVLNTIEFNSTRKRMSQIVRDPNGRLMLLCKGADTVIYERLKKESKNTLQQDTLDLLTRFAAEGLRTLVLAKIDLDEATYVRWANKYFEAKAAIHDRGAKVDAVAEEIEQNMELVGSTAIEDKLQDKVPKTIELLAQAGIKIWVLTGDKQETAINIGFACALLDNEMGLFMFDQCDKHTIGDALQAYRTDARMATQQDLGLVIQGDMLQHVLPDDEDPDRTKVQSDLFLSLATRCKSVICCRVSPLQKAQVVSLVRNKMDAVTLAIGDGANDVSMIQAAHVGIGISGLEGLQAARASDYAIAQFKYLQRLVLVHGRNNYRRVSKLILYCFYKNIALFLTQFWFSLFNMFTGQSLYDQWALSGYNIGFTAFPIIALAVLDKDVNPERVLATDQFPDLFRDGMTSRLFNTAVFWKYTINAIVQSLFAAIFSLFIFQFMVDSDGRGTGLVGTGCTAYTIVLFVVTLKLGFETQSWSLPHAAVVVLSLGSWYVFLGIYGVIYELVNLSSFAPWFGMPAIVLAHPLYWLTVIIVISVCLLREASWKVWKHNWDQNLVHVIQEMEATGRKITRRDVVRATPHLLPKQSFLNPYDPERANANASFGDSELTGIGLLAKGFADVSKPDSAARISDQEARKRALVSGGFYAKQRRVKVSEIVLDDL